MTMTYLCEVCEEAGAVATTRRASVACCDSCARWVDAHERTPGNVDDRVYLTPVGAAALAEKEGQPA
jgi:hypothetical protein